MVESRRPCGFSRSEADSSASTSSTVSVRGSDRPSLGEAISSVGSLSMTPSSIRKPNIDLVEATFLDRVVSA